MSFDQGDLAQRIEQAATSAFEVSRLTQFLCGSFGSVTKHVKQTLGDLGKELSYQVAAAGYPRADEGERLYDMVWYVTDAAGVRGLYVWRCLRPHCLRLDNRSHLYRAFPSDRAAPVLK